MSVTAHLTHSIRIRSVWCTEIAAAYVEPRGQRHIADTIRNRDVAGLHVQIEFVARQDQKWRIGGCEKNIGTTAEGLRSQNAQVALIFMRPHQKSTTKSVR